MSAELEIRSISSRRGWKDFYRVRCDVYRNDPAAVIPLRSMEYALLDDQKHPFYLHAKRQAFVAYQDGRPVGRIVAIQDHLHNEHYGDQVGFFGFFECPDDQAIADQLFATAREWLLSNGLTFMRGPVNPSMKSEFGVLVDGHEHPPFVMMGHSTKYYAGLFEQAGFEIAKRFFAFRFMVQKDRKEAQRRLKRLTKFTDKVMARHKNVRIECATHKNIDRVLREVNVLGNEVRSEGWGFVPMTSQELDFMVSQVKRIICPETVLLAYLDDELAGYHVSVPDINWAIRKTKGPDWFRFLQLPIWLKRIPRARCIALGAAKKHRSTGIAMQVVRCMVEMMDMNEEWEFSWVAEDNMLSMASIDRGVPSTRYKTYHLYQKNIA